MEEAYHEVIEQSRCFLYFFFYWLQFAFQSLNNSIFYFSLFQFLNASMMHDINYEYMFLGILKLKMNSISNETQFEIPFSGNLENFSWKLRAWVDVFLFKLLFKISFQELWNERNEENWNIILICMFVFDWKHSIKNPSFLLEISLFAVLIMQLFKYFWKLSKAKNKF